LTDTLIFPFATDPNRKLESRTRTRSVGAGYTTLREIGSGTLGAADSVDRLNP
jgi:hypothetical protein